MKKIFVFTFFCAVLFFGCKKPTDNTAPKSTSVTFKVNHVWANAPLVFDAQHYITPGLDSIYLKRLGYILSDFKLKSKNGEWISVEDAFAYIDPAKGRTNFSFNNVPAGNYDSLSFMMGLDSATNFGNPNQWPSGHALDPLTSNLHWNWAQGYVFYAMEGYYYLPNQGLFSLHVAFLENQVHYKFGGSIDLSSSKTITMQFNVLEAFQNPRDYVIGEDGNFTHSINDNGLATKISSNLRTAFSILKVE